MARTLVLVRLGPVMARISSSEAAEGVLLVLQVPAVGAFAVFGVLRVQETVQARAVVVAHFALIRYHGFHLDDQIATRSVDIGWVEDTAVALEASTGLVPAARVKSVEVVAPLELKVLRLLVVRVDLHVIIQHVPWHIDRVKAGTPGVEGGRPEVHPDCLSLVDVVDSF